MSPKARVEAPQRSKLPQQYTAQIPSQNTENMHIYLAIHSLQGKK